MLDKLYHKMRRGCNPRTIAKNIEMLKRNGINDELAVIASNTFAQHWVEKQRRRGGRD